MAKLGYLFHNDKKEKTIIEVQNKTKKL